MRRIAFALVAFLAAAGVIGFVARGGGVLSTSGGNTTSGGVSGAGGAGARVPDLAPGVFGPRAAPDQAALSSGSSGSRGESAPPGVDSEVLKDARPGLPV